MVSAILHEWDLPELVSTFEANQIDMEIFNSLTEENVKELIPLMGPRIKFMQKHRIYTAPVVLSDNESSILSLASSSMMEEDVMSEESGGSYDLLNIASCNSKSSTEEKISQKKVGDKIGLRDILETENRGKLILRSYRLDNKLHDKQRDVLVEMVINKELTDNLDQRITTERFDMLAEAITGVFPKEKKEIYFSYSYRKDYKGLYRKMGGGKLFRKFYNSRREFNRAGLISSISKKAAKNDKENSAEYEENDNEDLNWLKNSTEPWPEVVKRWKATYNHRGQFRSDTHSIAEYMKMFPALRLQMGYTLLESDCNALHGTEDEMFTNFKDFGTKLLNYAKTISNKDIAGYLKVFEDDLPEDVFNNYILFLIPLLLKPVTLKKQKAGYWKPSKIEMTEGFIMHVKIPGDIKPAIERRRNKIATFGLTFQPTPIIVGDTLSNISSCYVVVDEVLYSVPTPLKAVDVCFKVIHALNASYAAEAEQVWTLLQRVVFGVKTDYDKPYQAVEGLMNAIMD